VVENQEFLIIATINVILIQGNLKELQTKFISVVQWFQRKMIFSKFFL